MGLYDTTRELASAYLDSKRREFQRQGTPDTRVDTGGNTDRDYWDSQDDMSRSELRDLKEIRESGGVISHLVHAKALMQFGTGAHFESEEITVEVDGEEVTPAEWLHDQFNDLDNLLISLGEDAIWFPRSMAETVETRAGGFSHVEPIEPWTMAPQVNEYGEIIAWEQEILGDYGATTEVFQPDEIAVFVLNRSCARDKTGVSEVKRAESEITAYRKHSDAISNAVDFSAYPRRMFKIGRDGGAVVDDNELRRIRNRVDNLKEDTTLVVGRDVDHETLEANNFEFDKITEHDLRKLALALGLPLELANVGSDGLGSGMPADLRLTLFERQARAAQRNFADQFIQQVVRPVLDGYSPFPSGVNVELVFNDPISERDETAQWLDKAAPYLKNNEIREELGYEPDEDEELGESYRKPANIQAPEEEEPEGGGGLPFFSDVELQNESVSHYRKLAEEFDAEVFQVVGQATEDSPENQLLGIGINFPNSGVYLDWNIAAWPDDQQLDGPHVSEYATMEDVITVSEGEIQPLGTVRDRADGEATEETAASEGESQPFLSGGRVLGDIDRSGTPEWDDHFLDLFDRVWTADTDKQLVSFEDSDTPEFVKERLKDAIRGGAVFHEFETIPSDQLMQLREFLIEQLEDDRWNIDGIANRLQDLDADLSKAEAERIARTETAATVNTAREIGYEERGQDDGLFYWTGAQDHRITDACDWLIKKTNPHKGGTPVPLDELRDLIEEAPSHDEEMANDLARPENYVVHPNERKTWVRHVE